MRRVNQRIWLAGVFACSLVRADDRVVPSELERTPAGEITSGEERVHRTPLEPHLEMSLLWIATQLLPSPKWSFGELGVRFGLGWQVTPLLYSWGVNRKLSGWRFLIAEPNVRVGGSIEFHVSPDLFLGSDPKLTVRPGVRAYFPLIDHGENLSASFGVLYQPSEVRDSVAIEAGAYILFGVFGLQVSQSLAPRQETMFTFRIRYF